MLAGAESEIPDSRGLQQKKYLGLTVLGGDSVVLEMGEDGENDVTERRA